MMDLTGIASRWWWAGGSSESNLGDPADRGGVLLHFGGYLQLPLLHASLQLTDALLCPNPLLLPEKHRQLHKTDGATFWPPRVCVCVLGGGGEGGGKRP